VRLPEPSGPASGGSLGSEVSEGDLECSASGLGSLGGLPCEALDCRSARTSDCDHDRWIWRTRLAADQGDSTHCAAGAPPPGTDVDAIATSPAALFSHQLALWPYGARWSVLSLARVTGAGVVSISGRGR